MNVTLVNRSNFPTAELQQMLEFLQPCYAEVGRVVVTVKNRAGRRGCSGFAYFPIKSKKGSRQPGVYYVTMQVGAARLQYPHRRTYKKRAGTNVAHSLNEEVFGVLAHELRHIEQYWGCEQEPRQPHNAHLPFHLFFKKFYVKRFSYASHEVDAELVAIPLTRAYQEVVTCTVPRQKVAA